MPMNSFNQLAGLFSIRLEASSVFKLKSKKIPSYLRIGFYYLFDYCIYVFKLMISALWATQVIEVTWLNQKRNTVNS
jgi:hypothetical protein